MSHPLLVGIDVHRKTNTVALMDLSGREVAPRLSVDNNRPGAAALAQVLHATAQEHGCDAIHIAAEATGWYWWHLFCTLDQDPFLQQRPLLLYPFNPRLTANFRKPMRSGTRAISSMPRSSPYRFLFQTVHGRTGASIAGAHAARKSPLPRAPARLHWRHGSARLPGV